MHYSYFSKHLYKIPDWLKDPKKVEARHQSLRGDIARAIGEMIQVYDLSLTEVSMQAKLPKPTMAMIQKGRIEKLSTGRLLDVALTLGLKVTMKISQIEK